MRGRIDRYIENRQFGFISGADDREYFFHRSCWMETECPRKGDLVSFTPRNAKKGIRAKNVQRLNEEVHQKPNHFQWTMLDGMQFTSSNEPRLGTVFGRGERIYEEGNSVSPDSLRERLKQRASSLGANAVVNYQYSKRTGRRGNYRYTIHEVSGLPALIGSKVPSDSHLALSSSLSDIETNAQAMIFRTAEHAKQQRSRKAFLSTIKFVFWGGVALVVLNMFAG